MKKNILAIIMIIHCFSIINLNAQMATTIGGNEDDIASSILQTSNEGYIVAGITRSFSSADEPYSSAYDIWILYFNVWGEIEWQKIYEGDLDNNEICIQKTNEGGFIIGGFRDPLYSDGDIWIMKLSSNGEIEWQKTYWPSVSVPPLYYFNVHIYTVQQSFDGGYIAAGSSGPDADGDVDLLILKISYDGAIEWNKTYGGSEIESAYAIQQTNDGGYIVAGESKSFGAGKKDIWILKLSSDGSVEWQKTYGGSEIENAYAIQQTTDGGYIIAGQISSYGAGQSDFWILKLSAKGNIDWNKTYGDSQIETAYSIQQTFDGGYVVAGETQSFGAGKKDIWILKLNLSGDIEWQKTYGGKEHEEASSIQQTYDGGYIVAGSTYSYGAGGQDFLILKLLPNGDISASCTFINESMAQVSEVDVIYSDTYTDTEHLDFLSSDYYYLPQDFEAVVFSLCSGQHTLSVDVSSGGTTDPQQGIHIYDYAERISIKAFPETGYKFIGWSGDVSSTDITVSITMDSDKSLHANFEMVVIEEVLERVKRFRCFIATAAYGSTTHPHVQTLQDFRDNYLLSSKLGRRFVNMYYIHSPRIADFISNHKALRAVVRIWLFPVVALGYSTVHFGPITTAILLCLFLMAPFLVVWFYKKKISHKS